MKKIFYLLAFLLVGSFATSAQGILNFRFEGSYLFTAPNAQFESMSNTTDITDAFKNRKSQGGRIGAGIDLNLGSMLYVNSGVHFVYRNDEFSKTLDLGTSSVKISSAQQQKVYIPLQLGVRLAFLSLQAGPYFTTTIASKGVTVDSNGNKSDVNLLGEVGETFLKLKEARYEMGVGAQAQVHLGSMYLLGGVDLGLYEETKKAWDSERKGSFSDHLRQSIFFVGLGFSL